MLNSNPFDVSRILSVIRRWLWLIIALTILAAAIAFAVTFILPPEYEASTTFLIQPSHDSQSSTYNNLIAGQQMAITYSQMITERQILEKVISDLKLSTTPEDLLKKLTITSVRDTQLVQLTVKDSDPHQAQLIANKLGAAFIDHVQVLQQARYQGSLKATQDKIDGLTAKIADTQAKIDTVNLQKIDQQVELNHSNTVLTGYRDDYSSVQQNYLNLQQTIAQTTGNIYIAQPAQLNGRTATVVMVVGQSPISDLSANSLSTTSMFQLTQSYNQLLLNGPALSTAISKLGLSMTPADLAKSTDVEVVAGTNLVRVNVSNENADQAKLLADAVSVAFQDQIKTLLSQPFASRQDSLKKEMDDLNAKIDQTQTDIKKLSGQSSQSDAQLSILQNNLTEYRSDLRSYQQDYDQTRLTAAAGADTITISDPAQVPTKPIQNRPLYTALAGLVGLFLGTGLSFLLETQDDRIKTSQDVSNKLGLTTLASISSLPKKGEELIMCSEPNSNVAEDFRVLGTMIRFSANSDRPIRTVLVTSPTPTEGKSLVTANLGVALARSGLKVAIVDADLRLSRMHKIFNLDNREGLAETVLSRSMTGNLQPTLIDGLKVLTSGNGQYSSSGILNSPYLPALLNEIAKHSDIVLIDCPPVLALADATILASLVDGVLVVLRSEYTETQGAKDAVKSLKQVKANLLGAVLNDVATKKNGYYYYYTNRSRNGKPKGDLADKKQYQKKIA